MAKAYLIKGDYYVRYDTDGNAVDPGYPKPISGGWGGLAEAGFGTPDTALDLGTGRVYVFKGDQYVRVDNGRNAVDPGYPKPIAGQWPGMAEAGFGDNLDAAVNWGNGKVYFFRGDQYVRYDVATDKVDDGYPLSIAQSWAGLGDVGFGDGLDAAVNWGNGKVYFFKGDQYLRYDVAGNAADGGYPQPIAASWAGTGEAGFGDGLNAVWIRLATAGGPAPVSGSASSGEDHGGWVRLPDELRVGGTLAWRNNNPGNLLPGRVPYKTALAVDKRGLAIFPTYDHGWTALREVLRSGTYSPLSIADAMAKYAPTGHGGNDPALYANLIRKYAGLEPSRVVNTLDDGELDKFMLAIKQVEGFKEGTAYQRGAADIPADLAPLLD